MPRPGASAFLLYLLVALLFFGLPVVGHPGSQLIAAEDIEPSQYVWALEWWPHAILHGDNPFRTELIFAPDGYNLAWAAASIPGPSLILAPVTLLLGPIVAYNVLALLCPAVAGWSAFLLCRHLTGATAPSLAAGYLFGFSSPVLANLEGVPNLGFVGLLPLLVYLVVRHVDGSLPTRRFVALFAGVAALQFLTSNELLAQLVLFGAIAWALVAWLMPARRAALARTAKATAFGCAGAALLVSPWLYWMFFEPYLTPAHSVPGNYSADLLSYVFPTGIQRLGRTSFGPLAATFGGEGGGPGGGGRAYLGLPLLVLVAAFAVQWWRTAAGRLLAIMLGLTALCALGPKLIVSAVRTMPLPWEPVTHLPLLRHAKPVHIATLTALGVSIVVALWLARRPAPGRWALVVAGAAFLFPNLASARWHTPAPRPAFFADHAYEPYLAKRDRVFIVPFVGGNLRWQAQAGMPFAVTGGYIGELPGDFARFYDVVSATAHDQTPAKVVEVRRFLDAKGVTAIVVADGVDPALDTLFDRVAGRPGRDVGGVRLWRLVSV